MSNEQLIKLAMSNYFNEQLIKLAMSNCINEQLFILRAFVSS